jgi:hypothetical protein
MQDWSEEVGVLLTIWLAIVVSFSLYCLSIYVKPLEGDKRNQRALAVGILGLVFGAMHLREIYSVVFASLPHPAVLFRLVRAIVSGAWTGILVSMAGRRAAMAMLILAGILFVASPPAMAFFLNRTGHGVTLHSIFASPSIYILEAGPVAIAIPSIFLLCRSGGGDGKGDGFDDSRTDAQHSAENGTGA